MDYHGLLWIIMDYHWLSLIVIDYHWLSLIISDYHWLSLIINDCNWLSLITIDFHLLSLTIMDYLQIRKTYITDLPTTWSQEMLAHLKMSLILRHCTSEFPVSVSCKVTNTLRAVVQFQFYLILERFFLNIASCKSPLLYLMVWPAADSKT